MQQVFGTDNHQIQDEGCGHEILLFVPFGMQIPVKTLHWGSINTEKKSVWVDLIMSNQISLSHSSRRHVMHWHKLDASTHCMLGNVT